MKTLKFENKLVKLVLGGSKTSTWRLFDDKDLTEGDELILINSDTKEEFAKARIIEVTEKSLKDLGEDDWEGHEKFDTEEDMYNAYEKYYNRKVTGDDLVKIIKFKLIK